MCPTIIDESSLRSKINQPSVLPYWFSFFLAYSSSGWTWTDNLSLVAMILIKIGKLFSLELLNNGYVECTIENIYSYLHGFMYSEAFNLNVDKDLVNPKTELSVENNTLRYTVLEDLSLNCEFIEE